ncbi:MAG: hypothetical protein RBT41_02325 [Clostridia bacterium]|jgi:hypothetical protein|nr:hypothetical protein [Clostridia bacterium]
MKYICAELITETAREAHPRDEYHLEFCHGDIPLPISAGSCRYETICTILPQQILAATGRNEVFTSCPDRPQMRQAIPISVHENDLSNLQLRIKNNRILDHAELIHGFSLRLRRDEQVLSLPLSQPDVKVYWKGRGDFIIPLGKHLV